LVTKSRNAVRGGRRWRIAIVVGVLSLACLVPLAAPGGASAASVGCKGRLKFDDKLARFTGFTYRFYCTENILAYSVIPSKPVDFFNPEQLAYSDAALTVGSGELFGCEGGIPNHGFGCSTAPPGKGMAAGHILVGEFSFADNPCSRPAKDRPTVSIVVTTQQFDFTYKPFTTSSSPFKLKGANCKGHIPKPKTSGKGSGNHGHGNRHDHRQV
jgi:hypothetical protein